MHVLIDRVKRAGGNSQHVPVLIDRATCDGGIAGVSVLYVQGGDVQERGDHPALTKLVDVLLPQTPHSRRW